MEFVMKRAYLKMPDLSLPRANAWGEAHQAISIFARAK